MLKGKKLKWGVYKVSFRALWAFMCGVTALRFIYAVYARPDITHSAFAEVDPKVILIFLLLVTPFVALIAFVTALMIQVMFWVAQPWLAWIKNRKDTKTDADN